MKCNYRLCRYKSIGSDLSDPFTERVLEGANVGPTATTAPLPPSPSTRLYFLSGCHKQWEIALTGQYEVESDLLDGSLSVGSYGGMRFLIKTSGLEKAEKKTQNVNFYIRCEKLRRVCVVACVRHRKKLGDSCESELILQTFLNLISFCGIISNYDFSFNLISVFHLLVWDKSRFYCCYSWLGPQECLHKTAAILWNLWEMRWVKLIM